jgi:tetratricopeptide (TPR) repeat protein
MNVRLLLLTLLLIATALPAQTVVQPALPAANDGDEEVQKPIPFTDQELRVLRSLNSLPMERLQELLLVYDKLDNTAMLDALVRAILRRDPANEEALRVRASINPDAVTRPAGYLEELAKRVLSGQPVEDVDSVPLQAIALIGYSRAREAVQLLEALSKNQFQGKSYPFLDDLAYAYGEAGMYEQAEAAYNVILKDTAFPVDARQDAQRALPQLAVKKRILAIKRSAGADMDKLIDGAEALHDELPNDYDVLTFRIEAYDIARRYDAAIVFLKSLRTKHTAKGPWPFLPTLAFAYYGNREFDESIATFRAIQTSAGFDLATKLEAETMILEIQVGREIEHGMFALGKRDLKTGEAVMRMLEANYPMHQDVLGYRAVYLAMTGQADEALRILFAKKREQEALRLPFSQQDALADVYLELKQFRQAQAAALEILIDPRYDESMKSGAVAKLQDIYVAESLEDGYKALAEANRGEARSIATRMRRICPERIELKIFEAEVALAYNRTLFARDRLQSFKSQFPNQPFPGQTSFAAAMAESGDWEGGYNAYGEVLDQPGYEATDRVEAKQARRDLAPWFRPALSADMTAMMDSEGTTLSSDLEFSTRWYDDWRFIAFARQSTIDVDSTSVFGARTSTYFEGGISVQRRFGSGYFVEATVGGSDDDLLYGARVGKLAYQSLGWSLGFQGNARATDSVGLQALNGRENRAEFKLAGPLGDRFILDFEAYYSQTRVGGSKVGNGYGASMSFDYVIQTEKRGRPEISIGYFGEYSKFKAVGTLPRSIREEVRRADVPKAEVRKALAASEEVRRAVAGDFGNEVFDSLVDPETNRHGVMLKVRKHFGENVAAYLHVGGYYAFDESSPGFTLAGGVEYWISDDTLLYAELRYDSSGRGASTGGEVLEANIGGMMTF